MKARIDLTLERIQKLASFLPPYTRPTCHIAGTNGKGSVSALLSSIFLASLPPLNVGRFNSPHLISIHDSIVINDEPIASDVYSAARSEVEDTDRDCGTGASNFEILTLTALLIFERAHVDIVIVEVGMGGRLDATNIVPDECILVSALTAVDLDHEAFLGSNVVDIAKEKAAIARRSRPFVIGPQKHSEVEEVARNIVTERGGHLEPAIAVVKRDWIDKPKSCVLNFLPSYFRAPSPQPVRIVMPCFSEVVDTSLQLYGKHQLENLGIASAMVSTLLMYPWCTGMSPINLRERITPASISHGVRSATWPGRLSFYTVSLQPQHKTESMSTQLSKPCIVLADGAHNPASSSALAAYISDLFMTQNEPLGGVELRLRPVSLTYIIALSSSPPKTPMQTLSPLLPPTLPSNICAKINVAVLRFTPPDGMPWVKSVAPSELRRVVLTLLPDAHVWDLGDDHDPEQGTLRSAIEWATSQNSEEQLVVLSGSLYLVADFYRLLRDGILVTRT